MFASVWSFNFATPIFNCYFVLNIIMSEKYISVVIPNYNGSATIGKCLEAAFSSRYASFEVVVVDDCSTDNSIEIIKKFPCKLVGLKERVGVSKARNIGAGKSAGEILLFIDADCLLEKNTLAKVSESIGINNAQVLGGTYTKLPCDGNSFFSTFQSIFINYFETRSKVPDYIAAHCLAIERGVFTKVGGFVEDSFIGVAAGVEDVELSHRLRRAGYRLQMNPEIQVRHLFNFSFSKSMGNAFRKSMRWTMYSLKNEDLFRGSGTASVELKLNVFFYFLSIILLFNYIWVVPFLFSMNLYVNRGLIRAFHENGGALFTLGAVFYYTLLYPLAVGAGSLTGTIEYLWSIKLLGRYN